MGKEHEGDIKGFTHLSRAWYGKACLTDRARYVDEVTFGFYAPEGGTAGEMSIKWIELTPPKPTPQLQCFQDSWHALAQFKDVIDRLAEADGQNITPLEFCAILAECGFVDRTEEEDPYANSKLEAEAIEERKEYERLRVKFQKA